MRRRLFMFLSTVSLVCLFYVLLGALQGWTFKGSTSVSGETLARPGLIHVGEWDGGPIIRRRSILGFQRVEFLRNGGAGEGRLLDVPYWPFIILAAVLPFLWARKQWREHQAATRTGGGLCPSCSYDLTANVSGTCPECGTPVNKLAVAKGAA